MKNGGWFFCHTEGGGVRVGLTFVTNKCFFFIEGFPYLHINLGDLEVQILNNLYINVGDGHGANNLDMNRP